MTGLQSGWGIRILKNKKNSLHELTVQPRLGTTTDWEAGSSLTAFLLPPCSRKVKWNGGLRVGSPCVYCSSSFGTHCFWLTDQLVIRSGTQWSQKVYLNLKAKWPPSIHLMRDSCTCPNSPLFSPWLQGGVVVVVCRVREKLPEHRSIHLGQNSQAVNSPAVTYSVKTTVNPVLYI